MSGQPQIPDCGSDAELREFLEVAKNAGQIESFGIGRDSDGNTTVTFVPITPVKFIELKVEI